MNTSLELLESKMLYGIPNIELNKTHILNWFQFIEKVIVEVDVMLFLHHPADLNNDHLHFIWPVRPQYVCFKTRMSNQLEFYIWKFRQRPVIHQIEGMNAF